MGGVLHVMPPEFVLLERIVLRATPPVFDLLVAWRRTPMVTNTSGAIPVAC
jgi:hypothetical protein